MTKTKNYRLLLLLLLMFCHIYHQLENFFYGENERKALQILTIQLPLIFFVEENVVSAKKKFRGMSKKVELALIKKYEKYVSSSPLFFQKEKRTGNMECH